MERHETSQKTISADEPQFQSLQEIVWAAREKLPQALWDHLSGEADSETTLRRNRLALDALALRQRVLVDVAHIDVTYEERAR